MGAYWNSIQSVMSRVLIVCLAVPLTFCTAASNRAVVLPLTPSEVSSYADGMHQQIAQTVQQMGAIPSEQKTYDNTIRPWNNLSKDILANFGALSYVAEAHDPASDAALDAMKGLQGALYQTLVSDPVLHGSLLGYANTALSRPGTVSPFDSYLIESLLNSAKNVNDSLSSQDRETIAHLEKLNAPLPKEPFLALKGNDSISSGKNLTVLSLNTCFLPGNLAYIHGGMTPWEERVKPLASLIRSTNADVVCLQELHPEEANYAVYDALKNDYTYFYAMIGPRFLGFDISALGLPSGLFVASKYPIEKPEFTLYSNVAFPMNYGFFDFVVTRGTKALAHVYSTHMQSLNHEDFPEIRAAEVQQVLDKMASDVKQANQEIPYLFVGDFNIPWGKKEPGSKLIETYFYDDYNHNRTDLNRDNATWTDYYSWYYFKTHNIPIPVEDAFGTLDYALLLKSLPSDHKETVPQNFITHTTLVRTNDPKKPEKAISDHHALLTTIETNHENRRSL